jgi:hypothetical protein
VTAAICTCGRGAYGEVVCSSCGGLVITIRDSASPIVIPTDTKVASMVVVAPGGKEILRVPAGVTPAELHEQGFPDVAAALEKGWRP